MTHEIQITMPRGWTASLPQSPRTMRDIAKAVAEREGIAFHRLLSDDKSHAVAHPRQDAFRAIREETGASFPKIARFFAVDHSTVQYGVKQSRQRELERRSSQ